MNNKRTFIFAVAFLCALLTSSTFTVAINGLQWGVEVGDRTEFELRIRRAPEAMAPEDREWEYILDVYMEVVELGNLSVDYSNSGIRFYIHMVLRSHLYLANGTPLHQFLPGTLDRDVLDYLEGTAAIPIGNWTFASMLVEGSEYTPFEDSQLWGFTLEEASRFEEWRWLKSNGSLSYIRIDNGISESMPEGHVIDILLQERTEDAGLPVLLLAGAAGAVITVLVVVVMLRRR